MHRTLDDINLVAPEHLTKQSKETFNRIIDNWKFLSIPDAINRCDLQIQQAEVHIYCCHENLKYYPSKREKAMSLVCIRILKKDIKVYNLFKTLLEKAL